MARTPPKADPRPPEPETIRRYVTRTFMYRAHVYDRGQLIALQGAKNDDALLRYGHVKPVPPDAEMLTCRECGGVFLNATHLAAHGYGRHTPLNAEERSRWEEKQHKLADVNDPLQMPGLPARIASESEAHG